jgi:D-inositol-3-phosphate glycosyltransferase
MTKKKLLWVGDLAAMTGFGRVGGAVLPRLRDEYEITVLACNWHGDKTPEQDMFEMYPASNRFQQAPFGEDRIREIVERVQPDIICTLNDPWIASEQYKRIQDLHKQKKFKFVGYLTMDSYNWISGIDTHINDWDALISFTEFGAYEFLKAGVRRPISVIPHGLDLFDFYPMDKKDARKKLGLPEDVFIVFNGNRNQFRKRIDITISAFAKFAVDKPDTRLYLHMGLKDQGWDILPLFGKEMQKVGLDPNNRILMTANTPNPPNVEVDLLNTIYNSADVGVNTCKGGGWELVNFEQAACRVAQVVPDHTSTKEIFEGYGKLIKCDHIDVDVNFGREMPCPSTDHLVQILNELYENRQGLEETAERCYERVIDHAFSWETIAAEFHKVFEEALEGTHNLIPGSEGPGGVDGSGEAAKGFEPVAKRKKKQRQKDGNGKGETKGNAVST